MGNERYLPYPSSTDFVTDFSTEVALEIASIASPNMAVALTLKALANDVLDEEGLSMSQEQLAAEVDDFGVIFIDDPKVDED